MKKLNKPKKYSDINVEFYAAEVTPVQQPTPGNNNNNYNQGNSAFYNYSGPNYGSSKGNSSSSSGSGKSNFASVLDSYLKH